MNRELKTGLYIFGGLALATGIFFAVRALVGDKKEEEELSKSERKKYEELLKKLEDGTLTEEEKEELEDLNNEIEPTIDDVVIGSDDCPAILGNNTGGRNGCKQVAQIQTAINQKHNNNTADYKYGYCCTGSDCDSKLSVDGVMGPCTMRAIKKYYNQCCSCDKQWYTLWINQVCNCLDCSVNSGLFGTITSGADISDAKLCSEGYTKACNQSNFSGKTNYFNPTRPLNNNGYIQFQGKPKMPKPLTTYRVKSGGTGCVSDADCTGGRKCVNGICQITTRGREWRPGDVQWNRKSPFIEGTKPPFFGRNATGGPTKYLPPLMDRSVDPEHPDWKDRRSNFSNFTLSNKEQLRGNTYSDNGLNWRDQQGPLGDFYPGKYDFVNDNPPLSNLQHAYGMGKGFGFDGKTSNGNDYISYTNSEDWTEFEAPTQTLSEFYDDVP